MKSLISWHSGRTGFGVVCLFIGLTLDGLAGTSTAFDVPGAQYTSPTAINVYGTVAGWYQDAASQIHGFVRNNDGTISTFDVPDGFNTTPVSINANGSITGWYQGGTRGTHGFVRASDGSFTTFDVLDGLNTTPTSINASGAVVGWYFVESTFSYRSFLRAPDGTFTTFDVFGRETYPATINDAGQIAGNYRPYCTSGFIRAVDGAITTFDLPGALCTSFDFVKGMNAAGEVVGTILDTANAIHGFVRAVDGTITTFSAINANLANGMDQTWATVINSSGQIAGLASFQSAGGGGTNLNIFQRNYDGAIRLFTVPGCAPGIVAGMNDSGWITGTCRGPSSRPGEQTHGYLTMIP